MTRAEIYTRYRSTIDTVSVENDVDIKVAEDMVRSECEARLGLNDGAIRYPGVPEDFRCEDYLRDYLGDDFGK